MQQKFVIVQLFAQCWRCLPRHQALRLDNERLTEASDLAE